MKKLLKFKPFVCKEQRIRKHARESLILAEEQLLIATMRGGRVVVTEIDSDTGLVGQPMGLLLALTYTV